MVEWMENIEKAISKIMADKVYTSAEFKRERDNFHVSWCARVFFQFKPKTVVLLDFLYIRTFWCHCLDQNTNEKFDKYLP